MKSDSLVLLLLWLHWNRSGLDVLAYFHWTVGDRAWSTDRFGTSLVEGAD